MSKYNNYINSKGTHYISNCGSDEKGGSTGGVAGDQTGKEWRLRSFYSGWSYVFRYEADERVGAMLAELGCAAALNNNIGYDQGGRMTYWAELKKAGFDPSKIEKACEADCSSGVIANVKAVGEKLNIPKLKNLNATYTGNLKAGLEAAGFKCYKDATFVNDVDNLANGDILLKKGHTATNITNGVNCIKTTESEEIETPTLKVGDVIKLKDGATYSSGKKIPSWVFKTKLYAREIRGKLIVFSTKKTGDITGIVRIEDIVSTVETKEEKFNVKIINCSYLNVRKGPGTIHARVGSLKCGTKVIVYEQKDNWGRIGVDRWISLKYAERI